MCSLHLPKLNNAERPKVSVVIPFLNEEKTIGRVIQKDMEVLEPWVSPRRS